MRTQDEFQLIKDQDKGLGGLFDVIPACQKTANEWEKTLRLNVQDMKKKGLRIEHQSPYNSGTIKGKAVQIFEKWNAS